MAMTRKSATDGAGKAGDSANGAADIVTGILADADAEAARLLAEAEAYAKAVVERAAEEARTIARDSAAKADAQAAVIAADASSKRAIEERKRSLQLREELVRQVTDKAMRRFGDLMAEPGYRKVLAAWIEEAAIGLSVGEATVNASMDELALIDDAMLRAAEVAVLSATGKPVRLTLRKGDPLVGQGVSVTAADGRLAYNNQVATRFDRFRTEIRKLIYKALFDEGAPTARQS